jgi:1,4-alpha-glucan branching enzyme
MGMTNNTAINESEITPWVSLFTDFDIELFKAGKHYHLYQKLGSHVIKTNGTSGVYFAVWAPNALKVCVIGDFNDWNDSVYILCMSAGMSQEYGKYLSPV